MARIVCDRIANEFGEPMIVKSRAGMSIALPAAWSADWRWPVGSAVGGGKGKTLATVAGAAAGRYAGNQVQKNTAPRP